MGKRLISAQHFASEKIKELSEELEAKWERLKGVVEGRVELFDLSLSFHQNQHEVCIEGREGGGREGGEGGS